MTKLKTRLLKDLPIKTTPVTDDDYVINSNNGTTKLKVKDITKNVENKVEILEDNLSEFSEQLDNKVNGIDFIENLTSGNITQIKLIGDSVMWGADGEGYTNSHSGRLIYDNYYEMNHSTKCFANMFRTYINTKFPNVDFFNGGISGHSSKRANADKEKWIGTNNNCIILNLGLNDLWDCNTLSEFENNYRQLIRYTKLNTRYLYLVTTPITTKETPQNLEGFMISDVNAIIKKIANEFNLPLLDLNNKLIEMGAIYNVRFEIGDYFYDDDTHPSTKGHQLIWKSYQILLNFYDDYKNFVNEVNDKNNDIISYITEFDENWTVVNEEYSYVNKKGRVVNLVLSLTGGNHSGILKIITLQHPYIPKKYLAVPITVKSQEGNITTGLLHINIDGTIYIEGVQSNHRIIVNANYVI